MDDKILYLKTLSLEELLRVEVTSVSKKSEELFDAPAAAYVITSEDLRRSGATSIPEALRMVPGLQVAHIDANKWAISSRGFNGWFANKLLVLIDGRSVYTPLYSGVYWDVQDTLLEDIDRIEVIRGPGATLWGANAVNGVINIITKQAKETQGTLASAGLGSEEKGFGSRYGGKIGDDACFRIYAKYFNRDEFVDASGNDADDEWDMIRGGFRVDWTLSENDSLTFQGDIYNGDENQTLTLSSFLSEPFVRTTKDDMQVAGGNVLTRWNRIFSDTSDISFQFYYDRSRRNEGVIDLTYDIFDFDCRHRFAIGKRQEVVWGIGYRYVRDEVDGTFSASITPDSREDNLFSAFIQEEISLFPDRLNLTIGSKFEHNGYTGFEIQPNIRLLWTPKDRHSIWAAVSRAVRTPSRAEHDMRTNLATGKNGRGDISLMALLGNNDFDSEELIACELGYRLQPSNRLSLDLTLFYNDYDDLRTVEVELADRFFEITPFPPHLVIPMQIENRMEGETYGFEIGANLKLTDAWRLFSGYSLLKLQLHKDSSSKDITAESAEGDGPEHSFQIRSYIDLPHALEFDSALYYVDNLTNQKIPSYTRLDVRLGWHPTDNFEISLSLENLLENRHSEFGQARGISPTEVERNVYGKITCYF